MVVVIDRSSLAKMLASLSAAIARIKRLERRCRLVKTEDCKDLRHIELVLERLKLRLETIAFIGFNIHPLLVETKSMLLEARKLLGEIGDPYIAALLVELGNEVEKLLVEMKVWEI
ncbi:MAG TPA: hypothetical protein EYP08_04910 [Pyrodictiaceae archaeon]|nr:hypothetical protein [Pyrodictiaceae archaeon]